jgi:biopolymer transport protein ExbD
MPSLPPDMSRLQGKKAIRSFARKLAEPETIRDLNITPMMDMMTIILVFLLKSFTSTTEIITFNQDLQVPSSSTLLKSKEAIQIQVTKKVIVLEGEPVASVNNGKVDPAVKPEGENGYRIAPIIDLLTKIGNRERKVAEMRGEAFEGQLLVVADRTTPYRLLTEVLYSCGQAGYSNYRLLVLRTRE